MIKTRIAKLKLFSGICKEVMLMKISDEPISRCNKNIDSSMKDNHKEYKLGLQDANKDVFRKMN